jgi:type I protein arginine methyltransferase
MGHGLNAWFDATLTDGITFSNAPGAPKAIYGAAFFPWSQPVALELDDVVTVFLAADLVDGNYIWRWETQVLTQGNPRAVKATFKQSTFYGAPIAPAQLQKRAASYVPRLATEGEIDRWILQQMDGQQSVTAIAQSVSERYPQHFSRPGQAITRVGTLAQKYSR